jgi:hypothetical protein
MVNGPDRTMRRLIELLNKLAAIEPGLYRSCHRVVVGPEHDSALLGLEKEYPEIGLSLLDTSGKYQMTFASLLATVTDVLCGSRLCFNIREDGSTEGLGWWSGKKENG